MTGTVLDLYGMISPDNLGLNIANKFVEWNNYRQPKVAEWGELRRYIYATDTRHTSNAKLPWSNSTTIPKLTQIRDNLFSNYMATMFPKRRWLNWEGMTENDEDQKKARAIKDYILWAVSQHRFKEEIRKLVLDYIDYGNCISTVEWVDKTSEDKELGEVKPGFVGPRIKRISPLDIVFNPLAASFSDSPKIWRSLVSIGEAKEMLERASTTPEQRDIAKAVFDHCMGYRNNIISAMNGSGSGGGISSSNLHELDSQFAIDGFSSFQRYLESDYVELLTFAGDIYDKESDTFYKNRMIVVIDRLKVAINIPYPYPLSEVPIYHAGWRVRQDNLWAMGPLDNLVGMQYRLDHIENMKADIIDLTAYPVLKIRGTGEVGEFVWGPGERIYVDSDGDVDVVQPQVNALQYNAELSVIEEKMEEMSGSPKEAMGFRTPGEKTAYEVQRLENAASRIFQNKISQFEEQVIEPLLNAMLVLAQENLTTETIRVVEDEFQSVSFRDVTRDDISANGRLKPVAARHFAEQAEIVQNLTSFSQSPLAQTVAPHISSKALFKVLEDVLNLEDYKVFLPWVAIAEQAEAQKMQNAAQEGVVEEGMAPSGMTPDDYSDPGMEDLMGIEEMEVQEEEAQDVS